MRTTTTAIDRTTELLHACPAALHVLPAANATTPFRFDWQLQPIELQPGYIDRAAQGKHDHYAEIAREYGWRVWVDGSDDDVQWYVAVHKNDVPFQGTTLMHAMQSALRTFGIS